jgi:hypothetical protein
MPFMNFSDEDTPSGPSRIPLSPAINVYAFRFDRRSEMSVSFRFDHKLLRGENLSHHRRIQ